MGSEQCRYFNEYYLEKFFSMLGFDSTLIKKSFEYQELRNFGKIAA